MSAHKQLCFIQYASMNLKSEWHVIILKFASSSSKTHHSKCQWLNQDHFKMAIKLMHVCVCVCVIKTEKP